MSRKKIKYELFDAFPTKEGAERLANDLRKQGYRATVKQITTVGRLKWGVFEGGKRKISTDTIYVKDPYGSGDYVVVRPVKYKGYNLGVAAKDLSTVSEIRKPHSWGRGFGRRRYPGHSYVRFSTPRKVKILR